MASKPLSKANKLYIGAFLLCCLIPWVVCGVAALTGLNTWESIRMGNIILSLVFPSCLLVIGTLAYRAGYKDGSASTVVEAKK